MYLELNSTLRDFQFHCYYIWWSQSRHLWNSLMM